MELGTRLKQARLEAGLSQRQLCGDTITRNMLSQIENGAAKPSMETLRVLAQRLGKPMGWFLEEEQTSAPQQWLQKARAAYEEGSYAQARQYLEQTDREQALTHERFLLDAMCCLALARQAVDERKLPYAQTLLAQAAVAGAQTMYYGRELEQQRLLLLYEARPDLAGEIAEKLSVDPRLPLVLAAAQEDPVRMGNILDAMQADTPQWHKLRADAWFGQQVYERAVYHYEKATPGRQVLEQMEVCYRQLGDYQGAYRCACELRMLK